jgi:DNA repair protein RecO (recombination protein O)
MRISLQPAFILHRRPYRETSFLLDIFTPDHGRVSLIAKGVRGPRSTGRALLQPFVPLFISWAGKSELMTLTSVEAQGIPLTLRGECLLSAFYINELLMYLTAKLDAHPLLYKIYAETLTALQINPLQQRVLRIFEKRLLEALGYGLYLKTESFVSHQNYRFYPGSRFELCDNADASFLIFSGKNLLAIAAEDLNDEIVLKDAKRLMRLAFQSILAGKVLKSRELFHREGEN